MAFTAFAIGRVRTGGVDTNGAFFDPSLLTLTDLAATSATGTAPVVTSASYTFVAGDVNAYVFVKSGTNWTPGWYLIASVAGGAATLTATIGSVRLYTGDWSTFNTAAGCATTASPTGGTFGVDYSQQDAAQATGTGGTSNASTTYTDAAALFTVAMIGNALRQTSGTNGLNNLYYFITAVASTTSITLDRNSSTGAMTNGEWKIGGAALTPDRILASGNAAGDKIVAGNTVFLRSASGLSVPTSADRTFTAALTLVHGTQGVPIRIIGENGRYRFDGSGYGLAFYGGAYVIYDNLYLKPLATGGQIYVIDTNSNNGVVVKNCIFNLNDLAMNCIEMKGHSGKVLNNEFISHLTSPTARSGYAMVVGSTGIGTVVSGNTFYRCGGNAITVSGYGTFAIKDNLIVMGKQHGINLTGSASSSMSGSVISNNTIDANALDGIYIADGAGAGQTVICNNLITNHNQASRYGINVAAGTSESNSKFDLSDYNAFYNNTLNHNGLSASQNDLELSSNPYTQSDPPTTNWAIGTGVKAEGSPGSFPGGLSGVATTSYVDIGAAQRQESGGGGGGPLIGGRLVR